MGLERVANGVWLLRGDFRGAMNVYFIEDGDGVVQFDAGTKGMRKKARAAAAELGGVKRVVLGHVATERLVNEKASQTVRSLLARGLIERRPYFDVMNET